MAEYLEAINPIEVDTPGYDLPSIFLAGGITGCPDWQAEMRVMLDPLTSSSSIPVGPTSLSMTLLLQRHRSSGSTRCCATQMRSCSGSPKRRCAPLRSHELELLDRAAQEDHHRV